MRKLATLGLGLAALLSGCGDSEEEKMKNWNVFYNAGIPKRITVNLTDGLAIGPQKTFYDTDGDNKTVEQYVESYAGPGHAPEKVVTNLWRKGLKKPQFAPHHDHRTMTPEEEKRLDEEYQRLLAAQQPRGE